MIEARGEEDAPVPFAGSMEEYAVADVLQLLHASRRTGTLRMWGPDGQPAALGLREGALVAANHPSRAMNIGSILLELEVLDVGRLEHGLQTQADAGPGREPLVATLIRMGYLEREAGYRALRRLIEETVVEVVAWRSGFFELVEAQSDGDEFRHVPDLLGDPVTVDAQSAVVEALAVLGHGRPPGVAAASAGVDPRVTELEAQLAEARRQLGSLKQRVRELRDNQGGSSEISAAMLRHVAETFDRCVLFLARRVDLLGLGAFGLGSGPDAPGEQTPLSPAALKLKVPIVQGSIVHVATSGAGLVRGTSDDPVLQEHLYARIGAPASPQVVLLPLRAGIKTAALIYADFGARVAAPVDTDALEILAEHAGMALELALSRARTGKAAGGISSGQ
jgi:hypothetical protein